MTEIEFLAQLLLNHEMSDELKKTVISRIAEVEKNKNTITINAPPPLVPMSPTLPWIMVPVVTCSHEYPTMWHGIHPPSCTKCGYQPPYSPTFTVTCGDTIVGDGGTSGVDVLWPTARSK